MPPKSKFTREEIVEAALDVIRVDGVEGLTARTLAKRLGCSTRPIFTLFEDMDEVRLEARRFAAEKIEQRTWWAAEKFKTFPQAEVQAIRIAIEEPNIYKLVFMSGHEGLTDFEGVLLDTEVSPRRYASFMHDVYGLAEPQASKLFRHAWIYTYGIGTLCATKRYVFSEGEMERLVEEDFNAMYAQLRADGNEEMIAS